MGLVGAGVGDARVVLGELAGRDRQAGPPCQWKVSARLLTSAEGAACWVSALIGLRMREGGVNGLADWAASGRELGRSGLTWADWVGLIWFFSFPSPYLFPILNQLNLFEFKIEFEFKPHSNK